MPQDNTNDDIAACDNTNAETNVDSGDGQILSKNMMNKVVFRFKS